MAESLQVLQVGRRGFVVDCVGFGLKADMREGRRETAVMPAPATITGTRLAELLKASHGWNFSASDAFLLVHGGSVNFQKTGTACTQGCWGQSAGRNSIDVYTNIFETVEDEQVNRLIGDVHWAVHELGHSFVNATGGSSPITNYSALQRNVGYADRGLDNGGGCITTNCGFAGGQWEWQRSGSSETSQEFADMFLGWAYGQWESGTANGVQRSHFMNNFMPLYVDMAVYR